MKAPSPLGDDYQAAAWLSPSEIAAELGVSPERIGQTINRLGLRGNLGGYVRAVIVRKGGQWFRKGYIYSSKAVQMITDQLIDDGEISPRTAPTAPPEKQAEYS